jgi:5'-3' exonuclease
MSIDKQSHCFILTDSYNLFHRQARMTNPALGVDSMVGMSFHLILNSMKKEYSKWAGTHTVMFLEGRSWRKDLYPEYKANRKIAFALQTPQEQENHKILSEAFDDFIKYIDEKTNVTVVRNPKAEADDMIAVWIETHPNDQHILISSDSDFFQLLRHTNVTIYDPVKDIRIQRDGIFDDDGNRLEFKVDSNAKIKVGSKSADFVCDPDWYNYALFLKCVRGDKTDNIFSAYPGIREKGTKTTVGIKEAYQDITGKGYSWNNFMLQKWIDHNGQEQRVKDRFEVNQLLIDLSMMPDEIKKQCIDIISEQTSRKNVSAIEIGMNFMKFCGRWDLKKIGNNSQDFMPMLKSKYQED